MKVSLKPYNGKCYVFETAEEYEKAHKRLLKTPDVLNCSVAGRFSGGEGHDGIWTYVIYAPSGAVLAHELAHVILHTFERSGFDAHCGGGEPFCYLLSQMMIECGY